MRRCQFSVECTGAGKLLNLVLADSALKEVHNNLAGSEDPSFRDHNKNVGVLVHNGDWHEQRFVGPFGFGTGP